MKKFVRYFIQGLLYVAPLAITLYVVFLIFNLVDNILQKYIENIFNIRVPGLGVLIILMLITALGYIASTVIARPFMKLISRLMERAPLVKLIYSSLNDLFKAFVGDEKKFNKPVLVKVNMVSELYKMGFVTQEDLSTLGLTKHVSVYFPHSYNFSGEMFIVPAEHVRPIDIGSADAMKFIVSGGVTRWERKIPPETNDN
jgi:uncharacterized membrane protein